VSLNFSNLLYTQYINRKYKRSGRLWQNRFFSTVVEQEPYLWAVARYIECNPVRAGLVRKPEQYRWSSCKAHIEGNGDDVLTHGWLDESNRKAYKDFLTQEDPKTEQAIRRATSTGRPIGSEGFIRKLEKRLSRSLIPKKAGRPRKAKSKK
jgi:putative transposase